MKLHFGVNDIQYVSAPKELKAHPKHAPGNVTTGDVATWLENKYHVMETFYEVHQKDIANDLAKAVKTQLEALFMGAPVQAKPYISAESRIEDRLKQFLSMREMEKLGIPGVPTRAAIEGVSHRFKSGFVRRKGGVRPSRPSFIDTGLYQANMRAWID